MGETRGGWWGGCGVGEWWDGCEFDGRWMDEVGWMGGGEFSKAKPRLANFFFWPSTSPRFFFFWLDSGSQGKKKNELLSAAII